MKRVVLVLALLGLAAPAFAMPPAASTAPTESATGSPTGSASGMPSGTTFKEVVVSATKSAAPINQATMGVGLVTGEEMKALQLNSLTDTVSILPGVFAYSNGGIGQFSKISIRGAEPHHTQIRYDDFPLRDVAGSQQDLSYFLGNLWMGEGALGSVEVLKGTESTLYGSSAMGGVVSMFSPQKWNSGKHVSLRAAGGSFGTVMVDGQASIGDADSYLSFTPIGLTTDGYKGVWYDQLGFNLSSGLRLSEQTTLELTMLTSFVDGLSSQSPKYNKKTGTVQHQYAKSRDEHRESSMFLTGLTLTHEFSKAWETRAKVGYTRTDRTYYGGSYTDRGDQYLGNDYYAELLNTVKPLDWLTLLIGLEYEGMNMINRYSTKPATSRAPEAPAFTIDEMTNSYSAFTKATVSLLEDALLLNAGSRINYHSDFDTHATWDVGASYTFATKTRLYGNIATGYRTPSLYETYGMYYDTSPDERGMKVIGNKDLKPETSINYQIGLEQPFWDNKALASAAVFITTYKDLIDYDVKPNGDPGYINANKGESKGFELGLSVQPHDMVRFDLGYTHVASEMKLAHGWEKLPYLPDNKASGTISLFPMERLTLAATARWEDKRRVPLYGAPSGFEEDAFFTVDVSTSYAINDNLSVFGKVENLLDCDYTVGYYQRPGINFLAGVRAGF